MSEMGGSPYFQQMAPSRRPRRLVTALTFTTLVGALLALPQTAATSASAVKDPERNSQALTGWGWHTNVTPATVTAFVNQGNRIVDLEVNSAAPKFSVSYVSNAGTYKRTWWWYYGKTGAKVKSLLKAKKARLIDIEPYSTSKGTRYAVVMVKNKGVAKKAWGWHYNVPLSTITKFAKNENMRVIDVDRNPGGKFSAIYVKNKGVDKKKWWHYYNVSWATVEKHLKKNKARLIQLERKSSKKYDVVMQRGSGEYWWWARNVTQTRLSRFADQTGGRIFQVKSRVVDGTRRYDALLINNVNAESTRIRQLVSSKMTGDWGFFLKRVGGAEALGIGASNVFEPASMIKIVHAVTAMRQIQNDPAVSELTDVTWYAHPDFPARYPGDTGYRENIGDDPQHADVCAYNGDTGALLTGSTYSDDLGPVIVAQTLQQSDNRTTDALTRRFGFAALNATKTLAGMTSSKVNHRIGCPGKASPQPLTHNQLTLRDAGKIYEGIQNLSLLDATHRNLLFTYMSGGPIGDGALKNMIIAEANAAGLSVTDRNRFLALVETRSKGGSYGYCPNFDGSGTCNPPTMQSRTVGGIIWLPFTLSGRIVETPYVYGRYFDSQFSCTFDTTSDGNCSAFNNNSSGMSTVSVEMFRAEVKKALATW